MWRIVRSDLIILGFSMKVINSANEPVDIYDDSGHHINLLEFVGVVVNLWISIVLLRRQLAPPSGFIVGILADNTSALSWLKFAATTDNASVRALARLTSSLIMHLHANNSVFQQAHIPGRLNVEADRLSRLLPDGSVPTWASVTEQCNHLVSCQLCLLPSALLSTLAELTRSPEIEVSFDEMATKLLMLEADISSVSSQPTGLTSTLSRTY